MSLGDVARRIVRNGMRQRPGAPADVPPIPESVLELSRSGPAPPALGPVATRSQLHVAVLIPSFRRGGGGHATAVALMRQLRERGHHVSFWLEDHEGRHAREAAETTRASFREFFGADGFELHLDYTAWAGADVVIATGWQTVARALLLPGSRGRAYLVQDHEPDFYGASAERLLAAATYRQGLHCIAASAWLAELLRERYGASASHFDLAVDTTAYRPLGDRVRRGDLVTFYARWETPRRAVPLGLLALSELARRRPAVEIALFGSHRPLPAPFRTTDLGLLDPANLADLYARATVGMAFSLTNPSLIPLEMMACGLPCVELATEPVLATFGTDGPLRLADPDPIQVCDAVLELLDDPARRERMGADGLALMRQRSWSAAADQVEAGLRAALVTAAPRGPGAM